jgi:hypothetical protein
MNKLAGGVIALAICGLAAGYHWATRSTNRANSVSPAVPSPALPAPSQTLEHAPAAAAAADTPIVCIESSPEEIDGFPKDLTLHVDGKSYRLEQTGQFVRTRTILKIMTIQLYEIASFVESPESGQSEELLNGLMVDGRRKAYVLRFLRKLSGSAINTAINEEIVETFIDVDMAKFQGDIDRFVSQFSKGSVTGDRVFMVWLPGGWLFSSFNDPDRLELIAHDVTLARAVWRIWAGPNAGDERLQLIRRFSSADPK